MKEENIASVNDRQRQLFDRLYSRFLEPLPRDVLDRMESIVAAATVAVGETVLDVGTGTGALLPMIQRYRPGRVIVCDLSEKMLAQVAERYPEAERHHCDVRDLQLAAQSVDVVLMNAVFGNIVDKAGALTNIARMLRPGGRVVISHPEGRAFVERIAQTDPFPITPLPSREELCTFLSTFGLREVSYVDEEKLFIAVAAKGNDSHQ
jgi:ubiquinone/menaquinone biosynthesis C-methylase UbiE